MMASPALMGCVYAILGIFFTALAILFSQGTIWNTSSILLMIMATIDFGLFIRILFQRRKK